MNGAPCALRSSNECGATPETLRGQLLSVAFSGGVAGTLERDVQEVAAQSCLQPQSWVPQSSVGQLGRSLSLILQSAFLYERVEFCKAGGPEWEGAEHGP